MTVSLLLPGKLGVVQIAEQEVLTSVFHLSTMGSSTLGKAASLDALLNECIQAFGEWNIFTKF